MAGRGRSRPGEPQPDKDEECPGGHECPVGSAAPSAIDEDVAWVFWVIPDEHLLPGM